MCLNIKAKKEDCFNKLEISACKRNIKIRNDFYISMHILFYFILFYLVKKCVHRDSNPVRQLGRLESYP